MVSHLSTQIQPFSDFFVSYLLNVPRPHPALTLRRSTATEAYTTIYHMRPLPTRVSRRWRTPLRLFIYHVGFPIILVAKERQFIGSRGHFLDFDVLFMFILLRIAKVKIEIPTHPRIFIHASCVHLTQLHIRNPALAGVSFSSRVATARAAFLHLSYLVDKK